VVNRILLIKNTYNYTTLYSTNNRERYGEKESVRKGAKGLQHRDVRNKRVVPSETEEKSTQEDDQHENKNFLSDRTDRRRVGKFLNHFISCKYFFSK